MPVNSLMPSVFIMRVGDLLRLPGLQAIVLDNELNRNAAELAAFGGLIDELEGIADILRRDSRRGRIVW